MDALGNLRDFVGMAGGAGGHAHGLGVRILFHADVTGRATQVTVHTAFVLGRVHVQALAGLGFHSGIAMAGEAVLIGGDGGRSAESKRESDCEKQAELFRGFHCDNSSPESRIFVQAGKRPAENWGLAHSPIRGGWVRETGGIAKAIP